MQVEIPLATVLVLDGRVMRIIGGILARLESGIHGEMWHLGRFIEVEARSKLGERGSGRQKRYFCHSAAVFPLQLICCRSESVGHYFLDLSSASYFSWWLVY